MLLNKLKYGKKSNKKKNFPLFLVIKKNARF